MRVCQCGGAVTQHELVPTEVASRQAWTCTSCRRYEIVERPLTVIEEVYKESKFNVE